jgi:uncharacterized membrane protein
MTWILFTLAVCVAACFFMVGVLRWCERRHRRLIETANENGMCPESPRGENVRYGANVELHFATVEGETAVVSTTNTGPTVDGYHIGSAVDRKADVRHGPL